MQQAKKYLKLIERVALGVLIASLSLGIYFAFYPKVKDREKYKQIYLSNEKKIEELINSSDLLVNEVTQKPVKSTYYSIPHSFL